MGPVKNGPGRSTYPKQTHKHNTTVKQQQMSVRVLALVIATLVITIGDVAAQSTGSLDEITASGVAYSTFSRPGDLTMRVMVVGTGQSGMYEITRGTSMQQLLVLANAGWGQATDEREYKTNVRLLRDVNGRRIEVYKAPLEEMLMTVNPAEMQDGDILSIEARPKRRVNWQMVVTTLSSIGTLVLVVDRLAYRY